MWRAHEFEDACSLCTFVCVFVCGGLRVCLSPNCCFIVGLPNTRAVSLNCRRMLAQVNRSDSTCSPQYYHGAAAAGSRLIRSRLSLSGVQRRNIRSNKVSQSFGRLTMHATRARVRSAKRGEASLTAPPRIAAELPKVLPGRQGNSGAPANVRLRRFAGVCICAIFVWFGLQINYGI